MGERRLTYFAPCGISVLPKLDVDGIVGGMGASRINPKFQCPHLRHAQAGFMAWSVARIGRCPGTTNPRSPDQISLMRDMNVNGAAGCTRWCWVAAPNKKVLLGPAAFRKRTGQTAARQCSSDETEHVSASCSAARMPGMHSAPHGRMLYLRALATCNRWSLAACRGVAGGQGRPQPGACRHRLGTGARKPLGFRVLNPLKNRTSTAKIAWRIDTAPSTHYAAGWIGV